MNTHLALIALLRLKLSATDVRDIADRFGARLTPPIPYLFDRQLKNVGNLDDQIRDLVIFADKRNDGGLGLLVQAVSEMRPDLALELRRIGYAVEPLLAAVKGYCRALRDELAAEGDYITLAGMERQPDPELEKKANIHPKLRRTRDYFVAAMEYAAEKERLPDGTERQTYSVGAPVDDILASLKKQEKVALLGAPGAGKSTTLRRVARDVADEIADAATLPDNWRVPVFVALGGFDVRQMGVRERLAAELDRHAPALALALDTLLKDKRLWLLLDAANEMPPDAIAKGVDGWRQLADQYGLRVVSVVGKKNIVATSLICVASCCNRSTRPR